MQDFTRDTVRANQLTFEYLPQGDGPLALCVHGVPDSPYSYSYLLPPSPMPDTGRSLPRHCRTTSSEGKSRDVAAHFGRPELADMHAPPRGPS